jgi:lipopolysaccharide transport protein LptA
VGVAVVGVAFAVALVVSRRERPVAPVDPAATIPSDPNAIAESGRGRWVRLRDGKPAFTIDYAGQRTYPDGRSQFLEAHVVFEGSGREVWADRIETRGQTMTTTEPLKLELTGHVRLAEGEALRVEAEAATYDDATGLLEIPGPVTFAKGRMSGSGVGATYERDADVFRILAEAAASIAAGEDGSQPLTLSSSRMSLARAQNYLQMDESARIVRASETLAADSATMTFVDLEGGVRFLELRGRASVTPHPGTSNVPAMNADDITLSFHPETRVLDHATLTGSASMRFQEAGGERAISASWLDLFLAPDGRTVTRLDGRDRVVVTLPAKGDAPAREIRATSLVAAGTPAAGLQTAEFTGAVSFVEDIPAARGTAAVRRTGRSDALTLSLDGGLEAIREADFRGKVSFETGRATAEADRGRYRAGAGRLLLERIGTAGRLSRVRRADESLTVDALAIDLAIDSQDLVAKGNVASVSRPEPGGRGGTSSGLFQGDEPVYGSGSELVYEAEARTATYRGQEGRPARVEQGENRVMAATIRIEEATNDLRASGGVESVFVEETTDGSGVRRTSEVTADSLEYDDASRRATYAGQVVFRNADGETEADRLVLELTDTRTVKAFDATGTSVFATLTGGHEAKGERLRYDGATGVYTLEGKPAQAKSPDESGEGCVLTLGSQATLTPGRSAAWQQRGTGPVETRKVKCEVSIR